MFRDSSLLRMSLGMRKAAAVLCVLILGLTGSAMSALPEDGPAAHAGRIGSFALADAQEPAGFSLVAHAGTGGTALSGAFDALLDRAAERAIDWPALGNPMRDGSICGGAFIAATAPDFASPIVRKDAPAPVSLSFFMGHANGDIFSSLHELYAWRVQFKSLTLGAGVYRDIPIAKAIRIQPYVGVICSQARLRTAGLSGDDRLFEYRSTILCLGLPLVCGF